jgi:tetraacyldisaccharide 4'-kinase
MSKIRLALYPFGIIYDGITRTKNSLYNRGILKSNSFPIPLIVIGNLSVGGTGKTPHTEYIARLLKTDYKTAVLSRGYGRKTSGYILADKNATAETIGDEPLQIFNSIINIDVAVCEDRTTGVKRLITDKSSEVVILDDAFQHRKIKGSFYILLTTYDQPFYRDFVLPTGNLRETTSNKNRANIIIVSKCPSSLTEAEKHKIISNIAPLPNQQVFFTTISYQKPIDYKNTTEWRNNKKVLLVTGIVNPEPLKKHLTDLGNQVESLNFKDHHDFTDSDIETINKKLNDLGNNAIVVTTSKDAVKLKPLLHNINSSITAFEIPIQISVLFEQENEFQKSIIHHVSKI